MTLAPGYHEIVDEVLQRHALELVHIWNPNAPEKGALCGSFRTHICPESVNGSIAMIEPLVIDGKFIPPSRCWCGSRICAICLRLWGEVCARGDW